MGASAGRGADGCQPRTHPASPPTHEARQTGEPEEVMTSSI